MATTTVNDDRHSTRVRPVKDESRFSVKAWLFGNREEPEPEPFAPDAQSRWLLSGVQNEMRMLHERLNGQQASAVRPVRSEGDQVVYNTHPTALLRKLAHLAVDLDADQALGTRDCVKALHDVMDELSRAALDEDRAQTQYQERVGRHAVVAAAQGAVLEDAARRGEPVGPDSPHGRQVIGDMVGRALHASDPEPTALQVALTPDVLKRLDAGEPFGDVAPTQVMPVVQVAPATATPSPVHVPGDALRPPIPHEDADPGASSSLARQVLPRRPRVTVMSLPPTGAEGGDPAGLRDVRPAQGEVGECDWVFDDSKGARVLKLVKGVAIIYDGQSEPVGARVFFEAGGDRRVLAQGTVLALSAADARPLVAAHEAELDELEASR